MTGRRADNRGDTPEVPVLDKDRDVSSELEGLVRQYQSPLIHYTQRMLRNRPDQAQDVVQDTFLKLRAAMLNGTEIDSPKRWLYRVAHNLAIDLNRRENRSSELDEGMLQDAVNTAVAPKPAPSPAAELCRKEAHELALKELEQLPDDQKQILLLKLFQRLTLREISDITGTNIGTVHYRLNCGLRTLSQRFKVLGAL